MSAGPAKIFIQVESSSEQQEHLTKSRKTLKVLQKRVGTDKENLAGRPMFAKTPFTKSKSDNEVVDLAELKHKKVVLSKSTQTAAAQINEEISKTITEADLTSVAEPGEHYWKARSEQQRAALEETLHENSALHERIASLEEELNVSRQMLDEAGDLVEVLQEMIQEAETKNVDEVTDESTGDEEEEQQEAIDNEQPTENVDV